jgi:hypothetical protein
MALRAVPVSPEELDTIPLCLHRAFSRSIAPHHGAMEIEL